MKYYKKSPSPFSVLSTLLTPIAINRIQEINNQLNNVYSDENLNLIVDRESFEKWKIKLK